MIQYVSTTGGIEPVGFDEAVLRGFAADGGLFVPDEIPVIENQTGSTFRAHISGARIRADFVIH